MRTVDLKELKELNALTDRVKKRCEEYFKAKPGLMPERSRLFTESWKETEADPLSIRYAKAFKKVLEGIPIVIRDWELIVGSLTSTIRGCHATPEWSAPVFIKQMQPGRVVYSSGPTYACEIDEKARQSILEDAQYWLGKSVSEKIMASLRAKWGALIDEWTEDNIWNPIWLSHMSEKSVDHARVLNTGLNGVIAELKEELGKLRVAGSKDVQKFHFLQASIIACEAVVNFGKRYGQLARDMATKEKDEKRKKELEEIAQICEQVPAGPARNFREALQSFWICTVASDLESCARSPAFGRFDQYMYPFYARDIKERRLTNQEAIELLALLIVQINGLETFRDPKTGSATQATYNANMNIGGQNRNGEDAVNDLSFLMLEAVRQLKLPSPHVSLHYHDKIDPQFLIKAAETNRDHGAGIPAWFNDRVAITHLLNKGVPLEDAREKWIAIGCVESHVDHEGVIPRTCFYNTPKILELTLNNGVDPRTGKKWGPATGDPRDFTSYEQFYEAFKKQFAYVTDIVCLVNAHASAMRGEVARYPFWSTFMKDCVQKGLDWTQGGQRYPNNMDDVNPSGLVDVANSLAAIKKVVYEDKRIGMGELLDALAGNFEGKPEIHRMLLEAPKWGNDDDYADQVMKDIWLLSEQEIFKHPNAFTDKPMNVAGQGLTLHFHYGQVVGALPSGRKAWEPLCDGSVSAMRGTDTNGPTAVMKSASKLDQVNRDSTLLNLKLLPSSVSTLEGIKKFVSLIKSYMDLGGYHVQFNIIDPKTLLEAKKHPELYQSLVVRVAGYSAYFVRLSPTVQDEIIKRETHALT